MSSEPRRPLDQAGDSLAARMWRLAIHGLLLNPEWPLDRGARRSITIQIWALALLMLADLVLTWVLYAQGSLGFRVLAFVVSLPGAVVGLRQYQAVLRSKHQRRPPGGDRQN